MIVCPRCGKENQDHYKFCLGCGAELPRDAAHAPKSFTAPTPPAGRMAPPQMPPMAAPPPQMPPMAAPPAAPPPQMQPMAAPPMASPPTPLMPPSPPLALGGSSPGVAAFNGPLATSPTQAGNDQVICPKCNTSNNRNFKFCGTCGHTLGASATPSVAPEGMAVAPVAQGGAPRGQLVLIRADGSEGDSFHLQDTTVIGRESGSLFASDSYLSPRHAVFTFGAQGLVVQDEASLNGIYLRVAIDHPNELLDRSVFRIGQEIIRFERIASRTDASGVELMGSPNSTYVGRICLIIGRDTTGNCYPVPVTGMHLGRERGDILFPEDGYVSGLHCRLHEENGRMYLTDIGSSNGTFVRLTGPRAIPSGSLLLMGQQLFRVEY